MTKRTWAVLAIISALAWAAPTRVGPVKCKMCHKIQFDSWSASKHAKLSPIQDCETCHGPGSEYKTIAVMKNPEAAKRAGLLVPTKADCAKCHGKGKIPAMTGDLFIKVHAHKAKS